nr:MAG: HD family phosphohydrolase [Bacteroidota bacterium]
MPGMEPDITAQRVRWEGFSIPPLSATFADMVRLMNQPELIEVRRVVEIIGRDPAVTARILRIVNSAYYGLRARVGTVEHAVVLLGAEATVGFVIGMGIINMRRHFHPTMRHLVLHLIRHLVATGALAGQIAQLAHLATAQGRGLEFTAGLLHDLGKIVLLYNVPDRYQTLCGASRQEACAEEESAFGLNHAELGALLAEQWAFPEALVEAIRWHHCPEEAPPAYRPIAQVVHLADTAAYRMGLGFHAGEEAIADSELAKRWEKACGPNVPAFEELFRHLESGKPQLHQFVDTLLGSDREP